MAAGQVAPRNAGNVSGVEPRRLARHEVLERPVDVAVDHDIHSGNGEGPEAAVLLVPGKGHIVMGEPKDKGARLLPRLPIPSVSVPLEGRRQALPPGRSADNDRPAAHGTHPGPGLVKKPNAPAPHDDPERVILPE